MDSHRVNELDNLIRHGHILKVQNALKSIVLTHVPRKFFADIANFSWRVGIADIGLRLLNPIVRDKYLSLEISERELVEYANCLRYIGCSQEALILLGKGQSHSPWVEQAKAFVYISEWNYEKAVEILKDLLNKEFQGYPAYQYEVNRINFLACLIFLENWEEAHVQIDICLQSKKISQRLLSNLTELRLQCALGEGRFEEADKISKDLAKLSEGSIEALYLKKWQAILSSQYDKKQAKISLLEVRHAALNLKKWETVRDCDLYIALIYRNETFLKRLLFATPFPSYRQKIIRRLPYAFKVPDEFEFRMLPDELKIDGSGARTKKITMSIDVDKGKLGDKILKAGMLHHRLLKLLCRDLYRSHSVGTLFHGLFADENFNSESSPNRVHQAVKGLREYFAAEEMCLDITEESGQYRLVTHSLIALLLKKDFEVANRKNAQIDLLREKVSDPFTTKQVADLLGSSVKTAQRLIQSGIEQGQLCQRGKGQKTVFTWNKSQKSG
jgi:hypothetical protein